MKRTTLGAVCALALASGAWQAECAHAEITNGDVTGGASGGAFLQLDPAPDDVGPDAFESPDLIGFDEQQDVVLSSTLWVSPALTLQAGSTISSHYVAFDPTTPSTIEGFVDFDEPIIAVLGTPGALDATAGLFGIPSTSYSTSGAIGPDPNGNDLVIASPSDPNRLLFTTGAVSPGDQVRVLTGTLVPEPSTWLLLTLAACGAGWLRR